MVAVATTAAVLSPRVRKVLRCGAVYGLAGVLMASDAVSSVTSANSPAPACETNPSPPSAVTSTVKKRPSRCTFKVNSRAGSTSFATRRIPAQADETAPRGLRGAVLHVRPGYSSAPVSQISQSLLLTTLP